MMRVLDVVWQFLVRVFNALNFKKEDLSFEQEVSTSPNLSPALALIKKWEGFRSFAYRDPVGIWTIGYGTIRYRDGRPVKQGDYISEEEATKELVHHIERQVIPAIDRYCHVALNNNQFCALVSFIYNLGAGAFQKSTLLRKLNRGDYNGAAAEFDRWVYAGGKKLRGLVRRRNEEEYLFLKPREGRVN